MREKASIMLASFLILASAVIIFGLGTVHLIFTFSGPKLKPRDPELEGILQNVHPVITRQTTMWKAWIGFNASHSMGAMLFGSVYGYLAIVQSPELFRWPFLGTVGALMLVGYIILGKVYWFSVPFRGILLASLCYAAGFVASWAYQD
jgi:hypothetical protein